MAVVRAASVLHGLSHGRTLRRGDAAQQDAGCHVPGSACLLVGEPCTVESFQRCLMGCIHAASFGACSGAALLVQRYRSCRRREAQLLPVAVAVQQHLRRSATPVEPAFARNLGLLSPAPGCFEANVLGATAYMTVRRWATALSRGVPAHVGSGQWQPCHYSCALARTSPKKTAFAAQSGERENDWPAPCTSFLWMRFMTGSRQRVQSRHGAGETPDERRDAALQWQ